MRTLTSQAPASSCGRLRAQRKYATNLIGRIEHERRRLAHEYARILRGVRTLAEASAAGEGSSRLNEQFKSELGYLLGPAAGPSDHGKGAKGARTPAGGPAAGGPAGEKQKENAWENDARGAQSPG